MRVQDLKNTRERHQVVIWLTEQIFLAYGLHVLQMWAVQ